MSRFKIGDLIISEKSAPRTAFTIDHVGSDTYSGKRLRDGKRISGKRSRIDKFYNLYIPKYSVGDIIVDSYNTKYTVIYAVMNGVRAEYKIRSHVGNGGNGWVYYYTRHQLESDLFKFAQTVNW